MSAQGDDWTDRLIREVMPEPTQEQVEQVMAILSLAAHDIRAAAQWPSRFHLFRPGEYVAEGRTWEEYACALLVPVKGPVDLWRHAVKREQQRDKGV